MIKSKLISSISERISSEISSRNPLKFMKDADVTDIVDTAIYVLYLYTRSSNKKITAFSEVACRIGHEIMGRQSLRKDSSIAVKTGAFVLFTFEVYNLIETRLAAGPNGHGTYAIFLISNTVEILWKDLSKTVNQKLPATKPFAPWDSSRHETGITIVRTSDKGVLGVLKPSTHPLVFDMLNKSMSVGWNINKSVLNIARAAISERSLAFSNIWDSKNKESMTSKLREANTIIDIAVSLENKTFYHLYYLDFRGRKYPYTAFLHEQGNDLAKSLLMRADSKPIGCGGFRWLLISLANNWAGTDSESNLKTDKIPLNARVAWALNNGKQLLEYAKNPFSYEWAHAENPWQFIAACIELKNIREWQKFNRAQIESGILDEYGYSSSLEVFIDGTNNGCQHLTALTRDENVAPHVNLIANVDKSELPGDLYNYVATSVWEDDTQAYSGVNKEASMIPPEKCIEYERLLLEIARIKSIIHSESSDNKTRSVAISKLQGIRKVDKQTIADISPLFWSKITDNKQRRKICKRNIMTLPYGVTAYGLGQQQIDDAKKHGIKELDIMENKWGSYIGKKIYDNCRASMQRLMRLLEIFETAGKNAELRGEFLSWNVPITNFPVVQRYVEGSVKKVWVQYGPPYGERLSTGYYSNTLQLSVCFVEDPVPSKRKQAQGAAPNIIHSLDAAHMMLISDRANFPVTSIHDSFGCLLADMPDLFNIVRSTFVELHRNDILSDIMKQIGMQDEHVDIGELDIESIIYSEYCFS